MSTASEHSSNEAADGAFDTDVLVVGSGPTGATLALALATHGIRTHIISRSNWLASSPRAHITNQRSMEVFRDLGIEEDVLRLASPWEVMGDTIFATSLAGKELARIRAWGTGDSRRGDYVAASPCRMADIIQPKLEPILLNRAAERGASVAFNTEFVSFTQDASGVTVTLEDRKDKRRYTRRARYLVGADGARSRIVEQLDLPVEGHHARAGTVYARFKADLTGLVAHRPSILNWIVSSHADFGEIGQGLLRAVEPWTEWIAGWGFDLSAGDPDLDPQTVTRRIRRLIGDDGIPIELIGTSVWYVNEAHATRYHQGRVFCAGDAVHRHPPSNGLGMNTCVQDAFNLAWKLAYVIRGHAGEKLLDTFSDERVPVGRQIVRRANQSRLDYQALNASFRVQGEPDPVAAGTRRLDDAGPEGVQARAALEQALALKNYEFNAHGVELNQRYASSAVISDQHREEAWRQDPELYAQQATRPGAKLPHVWLVDSAGLRRSTLDVVGRRKFSLVTGRSGGAWIEAVERLGKPWLRSVLIDAGDARDLYRDWQRVREIEEAGALLVRPDGYVAWRHAQGLADPDTAYARLAAALDAILARSDADKPSGDK